MMLLSLAMLAFPVPQQATPDLVQPLEPRIEDGVQQLFFPDGSLAHATTSGIGAARVVGVEGAEAQVLLWEEGEARLPHYRATADGSNWSRARETSYWIEMQRTTFDPLRYEPDFSESTLGETGNLHLVQFWAPPLDAHRERLTDLGATVRHFIGGHTHLVSMDAETAEQIAALPIVRWVGPYHPEYRLESFLIENMGGAALEPNLHYYVQVLERGPAMKGQVAGRIEGIGGSIEAMIPDGFRLEATLTPAQLRQVVTWDEVLWIDRWSAPEEDMNNVRAEGGANYVEVQGGFTGTGVRAEVMDGNVLTTHGDLQSNPVIIHGTVSGSASHGTPCTGVIFGDGTVNSAGRGMLPDAQPIFADYGHLGNRYTHTAQLLSPPYEAVFQSNSWGGGLTSSYNSTSMEMDDILFINDIVILQSQSNTGGTLSRPQAWAKNIVSVGGIRHYNTLSKGDDCWCNGASTGPAQDGRFKPDLSYWYDSIFTPSSSGGYTEFSGTSAATPETAGHFGLFYEMWHAGIWGNPTAGTVFDSRPKATTARAMMINHADQYTFNGIGADLGRWKQGWGLPDVAHLYDRRDVTYVLNEDLVLSELEVATFEVNVPVAEPALRVTMVYLDPAGTTSSNQHRINDLSVRATAPGGTSYWGNVGLNSGNWSTAGGASDTKNVIESIFLENPEAGLWTVEVFADEINEDSHAETPEVDADFALVISGTDNVDVDICLQPQRYCVGAANSVYPASAIYTLGSNSVTDNDLVLLATGTVPNQNGLFYYGTTQVNLPFGDGFRCVGGTTHRLVIQTANAFGEATLPLDLSSMPSGAIQVGETWNFQYWYRDPAGVNSFNLTDALSIQFCN